MNGFSCLICGRGFEHPGCNCDNLPEPPPPNPNPEAAVRDRLHQALVEVAADKLPGACEQTLRNEERWIVAQLEAEAFFDHATLEEVAQKLIVGVPAVTTDSWLDERAAFTLRLDEDDQEAEVEHWLAKLQEYRV